MTLAYLFDGTAAQAIKDFLSITAGLLVCAVLIKQFFPKRRPEPREIVNQPLEISKAQKRFNREFEDARHAEIDRRMNMHEAQIRELQEKLSEELPEIERRINQSGEDRATGIHERVNEVLAAVSEVKGELNRMRREN